MIRINNTKDRFGIISILLHWIMALLIIGLLAIGLYMVRMPVSLAKLQYYGWHKEYGLLVLLLLVARSIWRVINMTPELNLPFLEKLAARIVHYAFYGFMFAMPITGWLLTSAAGLPPSFFGLFVLPALILADPHLLTQFEFIHEWLGYALMACIFLHISGALKHHFIDKDDILKRIFS